MSFPPVRSVLYIFFLLITLSLSGCMFQEEVVEQKTRVTLSGVLEKEDASFFSSQYVLRSPDGKNISSISAPFSLDSYIDSSIIVQGIINWNTADDTFMESLEQSSFLPHLNIYESHFLEDTWKEYSVSTLPLRISLPPVVQMENKETRALFLEKDEIFFVVTENKEEGWHEKFVTEGDSIDLGEWDAYRIFSGNQILFYIPSLQVQIDFWGEKEKLPLFYTILESLQLKEREESGVSLDVQENIAEVQHSDFDAPTFPVLFKNIILNMDILPRESDEDVEIRILAVDYAAPFISIEYQANEKAQRRKVVYSSQWDSMLLETVYFQALAEWEEASDMLWENVSGNAPDLQNKNSFFLKNLSEKYTITRPKDFIWYFSSLYRFSIGYREKMYYTPLEKDGTIIEHIGWSFTPFVDPEIIPDITLAIVPESIEARIEQFTDNRILLPKSDTAHFVLSCSTEKYFSLLQEMADTLTLY